MSDAAQAVDALVCTPKETLEERHLQALRLIGQHFAPGKKGGGGGGGSSGSRTPRNPFRAITNLTSLDLDVDLQGYSEGGDFSVNRFLSAALDHQMDKHQ